MANVYVIDAHPLMRIAIRRVLEEEGEHTVIGEASSFVQLLGGQPPDGVQLVLIDRLSAPVASSLRAALPDAVLLLFAEPGGERPAGPLAIDRSADGEALRKAVDAALGHADAPPERIPPHRSLSPRELEIFRLILAGMRPKEIAFSFGVSSKTVSTHRVRIMRKLGVEGDTGLTRYAIAHGLLEPLTWTIREKSYERNGQKSYTE
jgi:DNA-binding NarL/FixJ family response regulator